MANQGAVELCVCCNRHTSQLQHSSGPSIKLGPTRTLLYCSHSLRACARAFMRGARILSRMHMHTMHV